MQKFLLHTCCAPCSIAIIDELKNQFELTVFFYNPNIYPEAEYLKRKAEVVKVCTEWNIPMADMDYEPEKWREAVKGLETQPEGGARCSICFFQRLNKAAEFGKENNFDLFGTSLTTGRRKRSEIIHPIGLGLAQKFGIKFYDVDWKKGGRQEKGKRMVEERKIYRQNYCGCIFSMKT